MVNGPEGGRDVTEERRIRLTLRTSKLNRWTSIFVRRKSFLDTVTLKTPPPAAVNDDDEEE